MSRHPAYRHQQDRLHSLASKPLRLSIGLPIRRSLRLHFLACQSASDSRRHPPIRMPPRRSGHGPSRPPEISQIPPTKASVVPQA